MRRRTPTVLLAVLAAGAVIGACSQQDDPTEAELSEDLVEELREVDPDLTADQAECYAELLVEEIGVEDIVDVRFSDAEPSDELAPKVAAAAEAAREECGLADAPR